MDKRCLRVVRGKRSTYYRLVILLSGGCVMNKSIIPNLFTSANLAFGVLGYHILCYREQPSMLLYAYYYPSC